MKTNEKENLTALITNPLYKDLPDEIEYSIANTRSNVIHSIGTLTAVKPSPLAMQNSTKTQSYVTANER